MSSNSTKLNESFSDVKHKHKAEREIGKLLKKLNDEIPNSNKTCEGLWYTGGLNKGNSIEITYRNAEQTKGDSK